MSPSAPQIPGRSGLIPRPTLSSTQIMWLTVALLLPGTLCQAWLFGIGVVVQLLSALVMALVTELLCTIAAGKRPQWRRLLDGSSALTAVLIALALPPGISLAVLAVAIGAGLGIGKFAYGGLGNNLFNPAMVGYLVVLVSFPAELAGWPVLEALSQTAPDALSGATPLDQFSHRGGATVAEYAASNAFGTAGGAGWEWINAGFALGGLLLLALRIVHWRVPAAVLSSLGFCALLGYDGGSSDSLGSPLFHTFTGATCLTAFFIATDPVTQPSDPRAQWLFGALIGALIYLIRSFGTYADGAAFAILLANGCAPLLQARASQWRHRRRSAADPGDPA